MEIRRFGVGNRRPDGPPGTDGVAGQVIHSDGRGAVSELAFARRARIEPHSNPNTTWFVVIEGGGWVQVGDERARVAAGEAVLWPADVVHGAWTELSEMRAIVVELAGRRRRAPARDHRRPAAAAAGGARRRARPGTRRPVDRRRRRAPAATPPRPPAPPTRASRCRSRRRRRAAPLSARRCAARSGPRVTALEPLAGDLSPPSTAPSWPRIAAVAPQTIRPSTR